MQSILMKMQETVSRYASVLSDILKVDVEIVDQNLQRVAGTGVFGCRVNADMSAEGYVYRDVMLNKVRRVVKDPGLDPICEKCPKNNCCDETFEISTPIFLETQVIGVIGFVCFNKAQKDYVQGNLTSFLRFIDQISELISLKAQEVADQEEKGMVFGLLNDLIDRIHDGVIMIDESNSIVRINDCGRRILEIHSAKIESFSSIQETGQVSFNKKEFDVAFENSSIRVIGDLFELETLEEKTRKVLLFNDIGETRKAIFSMTNSRREVGIEEIIGESSPVQKVRDKIRRVSRNSSTVLITGESGTGKELCARAIHNSSARANEPFVVINCSAIPESLLESELFGYDSGAFTGASRKGKIGKFEFANNGTVFLDEIGELPLYMQSKLLRVIQEMSFTKIGSNKEIEVDVRVIAATNQDLEAMIEEKTFRVDLYYRLNVIPIRMPTLRERKTDLDILTHHFRQKYCDLMGIDDLDIAPEVFDAFHAYDWPGNVRELENAVEYMVNMAGRSSSLTLRMLPPKMKKKPLNAVEITRDEQVDFNLKRIEQSVIHQALDCYGYDTVGKRKAAKALGIGIATLYRKMGC